VKPHSGPLKRVRNVSGATILGTGEVCMVLNPGTCCTPSTSTRLTCCRNLQAQATTEAHYPAGRGLHYHTHQESVCRGAGYEVVAAVNGVDALQKLSSRAFDAVVSDVNAIYGRPDACGADSA
jgi:two-component system chemotaxis sensor kinase CheA